MFKLSARLGKILFTSEGHSVDESIELLKKQFELESGFINAVPCLVKSQVFKTGYFQEKERLGWNGVAIIESPTEAFLLSLCNPTGAVQITSNFSGKAITTKITQISNYAICEFTGDGKPLKVRVVEIA